MSFLRRQSKTLLLFAILLVADVSLAKSSTALAPTNHLDGAFQTFSGLNRLLQGEIIGRDFLPYLGAGPLYLVFTAFIAFGATLTSSVIAAKFIALLLAQLIVYLIFKQLYWTAKTNAPITVTYLFTALLLLIYSPDLFQVPQIIRSTDLFETLSAASQPGGSLRPIRAAAPYLFIAFLAAIQRVSSELKRKFYALIFLGVITALWSNDYSIPTALVFLIHQMYGTVFQKKVALSAKLFLTFLASWGVTISLYTLGHPFEIIKYNFFDVPNNQFWYFGPWLGNSRVFSLVDLAEILSFESVWLSIIVLSGLVAYTAIAKQKHLSLLTCLGLVTFLGGLVATVGGHSAGYFWAFKFWAYLTLFALFLRCTQKIIRGIKINEKSSTVLLFVGAITVITISTAVIANGSEKTKAIANSNEYFYSSKLGGFLSTKFAKLLEEKHTDLIEEYFGISSAIKIYKAAGARVDSVIHALGSEREDYESRMSSFNGSVITTSPSMDSAWTSWNLSANWWFYKKLFLDFTPSETSPNTITWRFDRNANTEINFLPIECKINSDRRTIELSKKIKGLYELTLSQSPIQGFGRAFAMVENNINFGADSNGYLALSPKAATEYLPFFADGTGQIKIKPIGGFDVSRIRKCSVSEVTLSDKQATIYGQLFGLSLLPTQLTDENWTRGFNNQQAGFFVSRNKENAAIYKDIAKIVFKDGEIKIVKRVEYVTTYINVWLEGPSFTKSPKDASFKIVLRDGRVLGAQE